MHLLLHSINLLTYKWKFMEGGNEWEGTELTCSIVLSCVFLLWKKLNNCLYFQWGLEVFGLSFCFIMRFAVWLEFQTNAGAKKIMWVLIVPPKNPTNWRSCLMLILDTTVRLLFRFFESTVGEKIRLVVCVINALIYRRNPIAERTSEFVLLVVQLLIVW